MRLWFRAYTEGKKGRKDHKTGVSEHTIMPKKVKHGLSSQEMYNNTIINSFVHLLLHVDHLGFSLMAFRILQCRRTKTTEWNHTSIKKIQNDWKVHFYIQIWYAIMDCTRTLSKEKSQRSCSSTEYLWNTFTYRYKQGNPPSMQWLKTGWVVKICWHVQAKWRRDTPSHPIIQQFIYTARVSLFSAHSSSDENSAIAMPDNLLPLSRDLKCLDCLGASGVWRSSKPLDSGSRGLRKVCTFEGVLYAKCDFFAIKVCWLQTEIGFKYRSKQEQMKQEQIKPNVFFKIWGTYCVSDCVWYMEKLLQIIMIHTTQYPNLQKGNRMINTKSFNQI